MDRMLKLLWLTMIIAASAKDLPGLDYLASGFDAVKMISNNEDVKSSDRSRFRLFDLGARDGDDFHLEVTNKTHTYKTPSVVQVTNINMRNRVNVQSISYSFRDFFSSYFQSYSFQLAIPLGALTIALRYHETLNGAYKSLSETGTALGMSTDWWSMFSVQLAPPYVLRFDPIFNRSLSKLVSNPTTDTQQMYYNQLVSTFGTHYTSSIVVGGAAEIFTTVSSAYTKSHNKQTIYHQTNVRFGFYVDEMAIGKDTDSVGGVITQEFKEHSNSTAKFLPAIRTTPTSKHREWDMWLEQASSTPVVVNRTLAPLTDLLTEYPIHIRGHLQLTIDFYLKNGTLPTIDQLSSMQKRKKRTVNSQDDLPGLDVVGCGYDIFSLKSKFCLLDLTTDDNTTWSDVFDNFTTYKVPDGFFVTSTKDFLAMYGTKFFSTMKQFLTESYISNQHDSAGFLGFGASTDTREEKSRYERFYEHKFHMAWTKQQIIWFTLAAATFPAPRLNRLTNLSIAGLPQRFEPHSISYEKFKRFFDAYGTHIVVRADIGGMLWAEDYFESCLVTKMTEKWVRQEIVKRYWFFGTSRDVTTNYHKEVEKLYNENSINEVKVIGGQASIHPFNGYVWLPTIKDNPSPVTYRLQPIYTLLPAGAQRNALKEATLYLRSAMENTSNVYIQRLQSESRPPPLPKMACTERRRRGINSFQKNRFEEFVESARKKFCPIIGYDGMFCPGEPRDSVSFNWTSGPFLSQRSATIRPLPAGVGMTIDISTGDILSPALILTMGKTIWTDAESGQAFHTPDEVRIDSATPDENKVSVQIFPTENDMARVWLRGFEAGQWSGGQFARTKQISDIYEKFFKGGQATAISQELKVLYTVSMRSADNPRALALNEYAQAAIDQLTADYDEELYSSFMDAWGTHITVSNKVGGMTEQQVIFKDCVINTSNFTDGITQAVLERNLKQELLSRRPCVDHFYWLRRKKYVDHRVGGNVFLINNTSEWKKSIVFYPALISIAKYIPWYEVVENETIRDNLRRAIETRVNRINAERQRQAQQIREERASMALAAQLVYGYSLRELAGNSPSTSTPNSTNNSWISTQSYSLSPKLELRGSNQCPTGIEDNPTFNGVCSLGQRPMGACALAKKNQAGVDTMEKTPSVPIAYERNRTTGSFRVVARRQYGRPVENDPDKVFENSDVKGDWVHVGCSIIENACIDYSATFDTAADMKTVYLCSGCNVQCADSSKKCRCFCPTYESQPKGEVYEPYCR